MFNFILKWWLLRTRKLQVHRWIFKGQVTFNELIDLVEEVHVHMGEHGYPSIGYSYYVDTLREYELLKGRNLILGNSLTEHFLIIKNKEFHSTHFRDNDFFNCSFIYKSSTSLSSRVIFNSSIIVDYDHITKTAVLKRNKYGPSGDVLVIGDM